MNRIIQFLNRDDILNGAAQLGVDLDRRSALILSAEVCIQSAHATNQNRQLGSSQGHRVRPINRLRQGSLPTHPASIWPSSLPPTSASKRPRIHS